MANTLVKDKTLIQYVPEVKDDPGSPGSPGTPERTVWETVVERVVASASTMSAVFNYYDPRTNERKSVASIDQVPQNARASLSVIWTTPLDVLRRMVNSPGLSATQAHYSDAWGVAPILNGQVGSIPSYRAPIYWTSAWIDRAVKVKRVIPATPPVPPRPPVKGSPARSVYDMHFGWNASAQSLQVLPAGWVGTAKFTIGKPVGAVVGFTKTSDVYEGLRLSFSGIKYGLVFGDGKIKLREGGVTGKVLAPMSGNDAVEATVNGRTIEWRVNGRLLHRGPFVMGTDYVLDAVMYAGGDAVEAPVLTAGVASEPERMTLPMLPLAISAHMGTPFSFALRTRPLALLASETAILQAKLKMKPLRAQTEGFGAARLVLRRIMASAASTKQNARGRLRTAALQVDADVVGGEGAWVPKYSIGTLGMLPLTTSIDVLGGQSLEFGPRMRALWGRASETVYGESRTAMMPLAVLGDVETITRLVRAQELVGAHPTLEQTSYITLVLSESLGAAGSVTIAAATVTAQAQEQIGVQDEAQLTAHIVAALMEQIGTAEKTTALTFRLVGGVPVLIEDGHAWTVNTDTGASTRYENYSFNSFATVGLRQFGVRKDGVYLLGGTSDAGQAIEAGVALGKHDFGTQALKHIAAVYAGVSATGQLFLRVGDGKNQYTYKARRVDADMRTQRFIPGGGLRANYFTFDLVSEGDFELDNITFGVAVTKRRI